MKVSDRRCSEVIRDENGLKPWTKVYIAFVEAGDIGPFKFIETLLYETDDGSSDEKNAKATAEKMTKRREKGKKWSYLQEESYMEIVRM